MAMETRRTAIVRDFASRNVSLCEYPVGARRCCTLLRHGGTAEACSLRCGVFLERLGSRCVGVSANRQMASWPEVPTEVYHMRERCQDGDADTSSFTPKFTRTHTRSPLSHPSTILSPQAHVTNLKSSQDGGRRPHLPPGSKPLQPLRRNNRYSAPLLLTHPAAS